MPELRRHLITGDPILLAPDRGHRPGAWSVTDPGPSIGIVDRCPFCPGNEEETPPELERIGTTGGWEMRVVPNKFPAVASRDGSAMHEVLIETRDHRRTIETASDAELTSAVGLWIDRYRVHAARTPVRYVSIFRNEGAFAGQSISHPHSQLIALDFVPPKIERELAAFCQAATCPVCQAVEEERRDGRRIVGSTGELLVFCPEGSRFPYEMWIAPARHESQWDQPPHRASLASAVGLAVRALRERWRAASFNLAVVTAPLRQESSSSFHWYVEVLPRMAHLAGYELGTGSYVNIVAPERAAAELRDTRRLSP